MGLFNKLKFWGKKDDLDFDSLAERETQGSSSPLSSGLDERSLFPEEPSLSPEIQPRIPAPQLHDKDLELINSKLDTIRAMLASIEQRLANVEQTNSQDKKQRLW